MSGPRLKIWSCKVGEAPGHAVPPGADMPMRQAVERAYYEVTGQPSAFLFSGWGAELSEFERAVVENRELSATAESAEVTALRARVAAIQAVVDEQAEDDGLWFRAQYATEAYLQRALRHLHAVVEGHDALSSLSAKEGA